MDASMLQIKSHRREHMPLTQLTVATPDIQRTLDPAVVDRIVCFQQNFYAVHGHYLLMGNITIARINGNDCIIDGQHRAAAYHRLSNLTEVPVEIFEVDEEHLVSLYKAVNSATPNMIAVLTTTNYKIINALEKWLVAQFPTFVKRSDRTNRPNVSLPTIKKTLENRRLPACDLVAAACALNNYYASLPATTFQAWGVTDAAKTIELCKKKQPSLFFSLYRGYEWIDRLIDIAHGTQPQELQHVCCDRRVRIPKTLRVQVWGQPSLVGVCHACKSVLNFTDFECGHIIAVAHGGKTTLDNLAPVCRTCNLDMGTMHMSAWIDWLKYTAGTNS